MHNSTCTFCWIARNGIRKITNLPPPPPPRNSQRYFFFSQIKNDFLKNIKRRAYSSTKMHHTFCLTIQENSIFIAFFTTLALKRFQMDKLYRAHFFVFFPTKIPLQTNSTKSLQYNTKLVSTNEILLLIVNTPFDSGSASREPADICARITRIPISINRCTCVTYTLLYTRSSARTSA